MPSTRPVPVDVILCVPSPERAAAARPLLSEDERERADRFQHSGALEQYLTARWLVRTRLSAHDPRHAPAEWRFDVNRHGAPAVAAEMASPHLGFNLSHTDGLVALAIARDVEVGVDVEDTERSTRHAALAHRYFAPAEVAALEALPEDQHRERFFAYWTLKEAYIKARGLGLAIPLGKFAFDLADPALIRVALDPTLHDVASRWAFRLYAPTKRHRLALAVASAGRPLDVSLTWLR